MDNLRWIMLGIGLAVILLIYFLGRQKNRADVNDYIEPVSADEMPNLSTGEKDDGFEPDKSSAEEIPFVPSEINEFELNQELVEQVTASVDDGLVDVITTGSAVKTKAVPEQYDETDITDTGETVQDDNSPTDYADDLIVIHVEAKEAYFAGLDLLKAINRQQLKFGDMNIYHSYDESGETIFSMSNMLKPGHFDPEHFSEMRTPGVIMFTQLSLVSHPERVFERLLHCAQSMAQELQGQLTSASRMRLLDTDIDAFRKKAEYFSHSSLA